MIIQIGRGFTVLLVTLVLSIEMTPALAVPDDDDLLLFLPAIISGINQTPVTPPPVTPPTEPIGLTKIKLAHGRWIVLHSIALSDNYFRFDRATATSTSDPNVFRIYGAGSLDASFVSVWCAGGLDASYIVDTGDYIVRCNWGFPTNDLGSAYAFNTVTDVFAFLHAFYIPSTGQITGLVTSGIATRISNTYKEVDSEQPAQIDHQNYEQTIKDMKAQRYSEYQKQVLASKQSQTKVNNPEHLRLQQLLKQVRELSEEAD